MPLAALILGNEEGMDGTMTILLPVAGQTLLEFHVRTALSAGAGHIVLLVDRMPGPLTTVLDRLKSSGVAIDIVRTAADAADSIHPDERLLVLSGGVVVRPSIFSALVQEDGNALLTVPEETRNAGFERIDAHENWAGLAMLDGIIVRDTAAMIGDWQLGPTLLRVALQRGARRVPLADPMAIATPIDAASAILAGEMLARGVSPYAADWFDRLAVTPLARTVARVIMSRQISVGFLISLSIILILLSVILIGLGHFGLALGAFVLAALPATVADILGEIGARTSGMGAKLNRWRPAIFAALTALSGLQLTISSGEVALAVAAFWLASLVMLTEYLRNHNVAQAGWTSGTHALALLMVPFFLVNLPLFGFGAAILYALATQIWRQRNIPRP